MLVVTEGDIFERPCKKQEVTSKSRPRYGGYMIENLLKNFMNRCLHCRCGLSEVGGGRRCDCDGERRGWHRRQHSTALWMIPVSPMKDYWR